jgi:FeS assembly protein IscX
MAGGRTFHWLDVSRIAEELCDRHPELDPVAISFPRLREMVVALPGFEERPGHPSNERILEAIQQGWLDERSASAEHQE